MEDFDYTHILQYLNYDVPMAKNVIELCGGFRGDTGHTMFKSIVKLAETHPPIDFTANVLILSDRLYGIAVGVHYFMRKCTGANVVVTYNGRNALDAAENTEFDYLVIAGYLHDEHGYEIIPKLRKRNPPPRIVMWARPDGLIQSICMEHNIFYVIDRWKPVDELVAFLKAINE